MHPYFLPLSPQAVLHFRLKVLLSEELRNSVRLGTCVLSESSPLSAGRFGSKQKQSSLELGPSHHYCQSSYLTQTLMFSCNGDEGRDLTLGFGT